MQKQHCTASVCFCTLFMYIILVQGTEKVMYCTRTKSEASPCDIEEEYIENVIIMYSFSCSRA